MQYVHVSLLPAHTRFHLYFVEQVRSGSCPFFCAPWRRTARSCCCWWTTCDRLHHRLPSARKKNKQKEAEEGRGRGRGAERGAGGGTGELEGWTPWPTSRGDWPCWQGLLVGFGFGRRPLSGFAAVAAAADAMRDRSETPVILFVQ